MEGIGATWVHVADLVRDKKYDVGKIVSKPIKEPWETSDLAIRPNIPASYVQAKKQDDGRYKLFFTGTASEVFEGETFVSAPEARSFFKVQQVKVQEATKTKAEVKFSVAEAEEKDLVAYHNLIGQNLIDADELGGMPMPSLAITKKDFPYEPFGDITMVGSAAMVDPEGTLNRVFDADTYSPTVPGKERDLKRKSFDELWNKLSGKVGDVGD